MTVKVKTFVDLAEAQTFFDVTQRLGGYPSRAVDHRGRHCPGEPFGGSRYYAEPIKRASDNVYEVAIDPAIDGQTLTVRGVEHTIDIASASDRYGGYLAAADYYIPPWSACDPDTLIYMLGNSLTYNGYESLWRDLEIWASNMGQRLSAGGMYVSSTPLPYIYSQPRVWHGELGNQAPQPDSWDVYLPTADLDVLTLQIHNDVNRPTTLAEDISAAVSLIGECNSVQRVYLYAPWWLAAEPEVWTSVVGVTRSTQTRHSAEYAEAWLAGVQAALPGQDVRVYPAGEIIHQLHRSLANLPIVDTYSDFFADIIHLNWYGAMPNVAGMWATIYDRPATSLPYAVTTAEGCSFDGGEITQVYHDAVLPIVDYALSLWAA